MLQKLFQSMSKKFKIKHLTIVAHAIIKIDN